MQSPDLESEDAGGDLGPIAAEDVGARPQTDVARPQRRRRGALERDAFVYNQTKVEHRAAWDLDRTRRWPETSMPSSRWPRPRPTTRSASAFASWPASGIPTASPARRSS